MNTTLTYRLGTAADISQLKELGIAAYSTHAAQMTTDGWGKMRVNLHDQDRVKQLLDISTAFLCTDGDTIAGMAYLVPRGNPTPVYPAGWCYVRMVGVHPLYRGKGISKTLMQQCIQAARESGEHTIGLHTSEIMNDARHIYEQLGFKVVRELDKVFDLRYWLFSMDL